MEVGKIENTLLSLIKNEGTICLALLDSENINARNSTIISKKAEKLGVKAILIGGSTAIDQIELYKIIKAIKKTVKIPIILFPSNVTGISPNADAILFSSLLNSENPYYIIQAQALGALLIKKYDLEAIPMAYLVINHGGTIGYIGHARGIPSNKPEIAIMYALAAQYLGMRFLYLEAGSGVTSQISPNILKAVRKYYQGTIIVGGGITSTKSAKLLSKSGADILVIGNLLEKKNFEFDLKKIITALKN